jgi:hypothetical protein
MRFDLGEAKLVNPMKHMVSVFRIIVGKKMAAFSKKIENIDEIWTKETINNDQWPPVELVLSRDWLRPDLISAFVMFRDKAFAIRRALPGAPCLRASCASSVSIAWPLPVVQRIFTIRRVSRPVGSLVLRYRPVLATDCPARL